jgi:hypothetical protein
LKTLRLRLLECGWYQTCCLLRAPSKLAVTKGATLRHTELTYEAFQAIIESRFQRGLAHRLASVRPARELMKFAQPEELDYRALSEFPKFSMARAIDPIEAKELAWKAGLGPGYSIARAQEYLRNRYERTLNGLRLTLPRLLTDEHSRQVIARLGTDGLLDWQILSILFNIVGQYQTHQLIGGDAASERFRRAMFERMKRDEREDDPPFDLRYLTEEMVEAQRSISSAAAFHTWDLEINRQTPDFIAMKRLLDERYGHSSDDITHDDPFPGIGRPPGRGLAA